MDSEKILKGAVKEGKIVIGRKSVARGFKTGTLSAVFIPSNCPADAAKEAAYYAKIGKVQMHSFSGNSAELGQSCGKPFKIAILGIEK
jgi:large subunit ribosomal protein L30e